MARPSGAVIDTSRLSVVQISKDRDIRAFVEQNHYSRSYPAARRRFGLLQDGLLVGVSVFSQPMSDKIFNVFDAPAIRCLELGRLILLDRIESNAETWFLSRCFAPLKQEGFMGIIAMSDPTPRRNEHGDIIFSGHYGCVYQALNGHYIGRGTARTLYLLPDGSVFSARSASKIRAKSKGWRYAVKQLTDAGARMPSEGEDLRNWLRDSMLSVTRKIRHRGNHQYAWALNRRAWRNPPPRLKYPKETDPA